MVNKRPNCFIDFEDVPHRDAWKTSKVENSNSKLFLEFVSKSIDILHHLITLANFVSPNYKELASEGGKNWAERHTQSEEIEECILCIVCLWKKERQWEKSEGVRVLLNVWGIMKCFASLWRWGINHAWRLI